MGGEWSEIEIRLRLSSAKLLTGTGTGTELGNKKKPLSEYHIIYISSVWYLLTDEDKSDHKTNTFISCLPVISNTCLS